MTYKKLKEVLNNYLSETKIEKLYDKLKIREWYINVSKRIDQENKI